MQKSINYKHLHYFWVVAKEGSIASASQQLHITPQTISGQLSLLEESLGSSLFDRMGRGLVLTEQGRIAFRYAEEIFNLGNELSDVIREEGRAGQLEFVVGILDCIPKTIAYKLLAPTFASIPGINIICQEGSLEQILSDLAVHKIDLVLADMPLNSAYNIKAYNHFLGKSDITFFASPELAKKYRKDFPSCLDQAPFLIPTQKSTIRRALDQWFSEMDISPNIVGQFDDSALLKAFGQAGMGIFSMPQIIEKEVCNQFNVEVVGRTKTVQEEFYAISAERKIKHPAIATICGAARDRLFS